MSPVVLTALLALLEFARDRLKAARKAAVERAAPIKVVLGTLDLVVGVLAAFGAVGAFFRFDWWVAILCVLAALILSSVAGSVVDHYRLVSARFALGASAVAFAALAAAAVLPQAP